MRPAAPRTLTILLGAVATVWAAGLAGCGNEGPDAATTTSTETTTTAAPTTTEAPGTPVDPAVLTLGDCFEDRVVAGQGQTEIDEQQTVLVDCDDPHRNEVYLVTRLADEIGGPFPGGEAITAAADELCLAGFADFVGLQFELSIWEIGYTVPTEATWALPDRTVTCFLFHREGDKVSGSARDSAR